MSEVCFYIDVHEDTPKVVRRISRALALRMIRHATHQRFHRWLIFTEDNVIVVEEYPGPKNTLIKIEGYTRVMPIIIRALGKAVWDVRIYQKGCDLL